MTTETFSGRGTAGEMAIITRKDDASGRIMVCVESWIDTFGDDGPEPMATWRDVTEEERATPEYTRLAKSMALTRQQHAAWDANTAAARKSVKESLAQAAPDTATYNALPDDFDAKMSRIFG